MTATDKFVPQGDLEENTLVISLIRVFTVPILNSLPRSFIKKIMRHSNHDATSVLKHVGSTSALEVMYTMHTKHARKSVVNGIMRSITDIFWNRVVSQPRALRNRLKVTRDAIENHISVLIRKREEQGDKTTILILSVAGGSARSIIQSIVDLKNKGNKQDIKVYVLDKDQVALDIGRKLSVTAGVASNFQWVRGRTRDIRKLISEENFDLVEIVGLLDYFDDEKLVYLVKEMRDIMCQDGALIVANIMPNPEVTFISKTGWPEMVYRTPESFKSILKKSGFPNINTIVEPLKVHCIAIAKNERD